MAKNNNKDEPNTAPLPDRWYNLRLGSSFKDHSSSSKFCTLRYEFKPASIDKNQPGTLHKTKDKRITVEFHNNQPGKPNVTFEGSSSEVKTSDAVLLFDGEKFRLEQLHRAVKRLRHQRQPGESTAAAVGSSVGLPTEPSSPPVGKGAKFQPMTKAVLPPMPVEVERIEIGEVRGSDAKPRNEKVADNPSSNSNHLSTSPDIMTDDLEEQLDIINDDDDDIGGTANGVNPTVGELNIGIDINMPKQNDTDDEIADVDASDDEVDKGRNAAEALRAQVDAEERERQTSSPSSSSGSDSSGSGSGSGSSSSDSESSDGDSVNSV